MDDPGPYTNLLLSALIEVALLYKVSGHPNVLSLSGFQIPIKSKKTSNQSKSIEFSQILNKSINSNRTRSLLKIQDGCDFMCSFCVIPFARGRSRYRDFSSINFFGFESCT